MQRGVSRLSHAGDFAPQLYEFLLKIHGNNRFIFDDQQLSIHSASL
jgi:hypothetical protein